MDARDSLGLPGFRHILLCLDRSETAETALPLVGYMAGLGEVQVTLVHVLESRGDAAALHVTDALDWEIAREEAHAYLEQVRAWLDQRGIPVQVVVVDGPAPGRIAAIALELDADLTVLSTHGEGGGGAWNLGSTASKLLSLVHSSVLVVPANGGEPSPSVPPRRILVPLDGSVRSECVLPTVVRLSRAADQAEVLFAHLVAEPVRTEVLSTDEDIELARELTRRQVSGAEAYLEIVMSRLSSDAVRSRTVVNQSTDPLDGLALLATAQRADMVVLCAHGAVCNSQRPFGSVAAHLIAHSRVPVLVVQDLPQRRGRTTTPSCAPYLPRSIDDARPV